VSSRLGLILVEQASRAPVRSRAAAGTENARVDVGYAHRDVWVVADPVVARLGRAVGLLWGPVDSTEARLALW
jgi:hypothetical protein